MDKPGEAGEFMTRFRAQNIEDKRAREYGKERSGDFWAVARGDYSRPLWINEFGTLRVTGIDQKTLRRGSESEEVLGVEKSLDHMVEELLAKSEKRPIVVMDFGGGIGLTWCRLAKKYEEAVKQGLLTFVVTNIESGYDLDAALNTRVSSEHEGDVVKLVRYAKNNNLVQYVEGELIGKDTKDIRSLRKLSLKVGGRLVPLYGNVDIIHTRMSLLHSKIPEIHYPRLFELMSENGMFLETSFYQDVFASPNASLDTRVYTNSNTRQPVYEAYQYVKDAFSMQPVEFVEDGPNKGKKVVSSILRKRRDGVPRVWD